MAKSPVPTLSDLWGSRKDSSLIMQRPRSPKVEKKFNFPANNSKEEWQMVTSAVTALFQRKKLSNLELDSLTEKVKQVKADFGNAELCKRLKESILVKGMIILRDIKVNSGAQLLDKLASTWTHFFHNVLPLVQAIFVNLQPADGNSVRDLSLITFRDIVVLKTKLEEAFQMGLPPPPPVVQMLLILQSVHDSTPPNKNYKRLETLVSYVVSPYLSSSGLRTKPITHPISNQNNTKTFGTDSNSSSSGRIPRPASALQLSKSTDKLDPVMEVEQANRRHTFTGTDESVFSSQNIDTNSSVPNSSDNTKDTKM